MNTSSSHFFDTTILRQSASLPAPSSARANTPAAERKANPASTMSTSLWRHTQAECEATQRHGLVVRGICGLLGVLSIGSVAAAAWQMHALLSGNHLHAAVSAFLR